jgi:hypothetical protein
VELLLWIVEDISLFDLAVEPPVVWEDQRRKL